MKNLLYALLLISGIACSQIQIIHFNASWNAANDVSWFDDLTDAKLKRIDIAADAAAGTDWKITVVPTILIIVEERYQADISFSMKATKEEVQEAIDEILMDQF